MDWNNPAIWKGIIPIAIVAVMAIWGMVQVSLRSNEIIRFMKRQYKRLKLYLKN